MKKNKNEKKSAPLSAKRNNEDLPGYPIYPVKDDIYNREKEEEDINPEFPTTRKSANEAPDRLNEKDFREDKTGSDLDVPGAELDDEQEIIGSEDEENN